MTPRTTNATTTPMTIQTHVSMRLLSVARETEGGCQWVPRRGRSKLRQLRAQELVHDLRIRLALRLFHHLADEEPEQALFAALVRGDLARVVREDARDERLELCRVGD